MQLITMKKPLQLFLIILLASTAQLRADENLPVPFEASYKIFKKGTEVAVMKRSLSQIDNGDFIYRSETKSTGLVSIFYKLHILEESHWHLQDQQLKPLVYSFIRIKKKKESNKKTVFDWKINQANFVDNGIKSSFDLEPGMTDKLLYQINIMRDLKMGRHPTTYTVVDGMKIKTYHFEHLGEELIDTPIGRFNTIKFARQKPGKKEKIILWCANELNYLPIRVDSIDDDGSITTAMIDKLTGLNQPEENYLSPENSE